MLHLVGNPSYGGYFRGRCKSVRLPGCRFKAKNPRGCFRVCLVFLVRLWPKGFDLSIHAFIDFTLDGAPNQRKDTRGTKNQPQHTSFPSTITGAWPAALQ